MNIKGLLEIYKTLQSDAKIPCPRCGRDRMLEGARNALSRHEDIYICPQCGTEEAVFDAAGKILPLEEWYAIKRITNNPVVVIEHNGPRKEYLLEARVRFNITEKAIDDIMSTALEGGINYWCNCAEVVEDEYFGEYASDQISRGGSLRLYDAEEDKSYVLTLEKFLKGVSLYVANGPDEIIEDGEVEAYNVDALVADAIIQYALFDEVVFG